MQSQLRVSAQSLIRSLFKVYGAVPKRISGSGFGWTRLRPHARLIFRYYPERCPCPPGKEFSTLCYLFRRPCARLQRRLHLTILSIILSYLVCLINYTELSYATHGQPFFESLAVCLDDPPIVLKRHSVTNTTLLERSGCRRSATLTRQPHSVFRTNLWALLPTRGRMYLEGQHRGRYRPLGVAFDFAFTASSLLSSAQPLM